MDELIFKPIWYLRSKKEVRKIFKQLEQRKLINSWSSVVSPNHCQGGYEEVFYYRKRGARELPVFKIVMDGARISPTFYTSSGMDTLIQEVTG